MNINVGRKGYVALGAYSPNEVFKAVHDANKGFFNPDNKRLKAKIGDSVFKANSYRYEVFRQSCICVTCGLVGSMFVLERHSSQPDSNPHFNLYGIRDNKFVLMTKDHINPKFNGGRDRLDNFQTMCQPCNTEKGSEYVSLA